MEIRKMNPANEEMLSQVSSLHASTSSAIRMLIKSEQPHSNEVAWLGENLRGMLELLGQIIVSLDRMQSREINLLDKVV